MNRTSLMARATALALGLVSGAAFAQHQGHDMSSMPGMVMPPPKPVPAKKPAPANKATPTLQAAPTRAPRAPARRATSSKPAGAAAPTGAMDHAGHGAMAMPGRPTKAATAPRAAPGKRAAPSKPGPSSARPSGKTGAMDHSKMDMGAMDHGAMDHSKMDMGAMDHGTMDHSKMDMGTTDHGAMDHSKMDVGAMDHGTMDHSKMDMGTVDHGAMDHSKMDMGTVDHGAMDHSKMDMGTMDHGAMDHSKMDMSRPAPLPADAAPRTPIPPITEADRAAAFPDVDGHTTHDSTVHTFWLADRLEVYDAPRSGAWEGMAWIGGDLNRAWLRSEGEVEDGRVDRGDVEAFYGRSVDTWWDVLAGVRQDFGVGPDRTWAAIGVQGLAPYKFEVAATAYVGASGRTAARLEGEYETLFTNRLILQWRGEANLYGRDDPGQRVGSGLSTLEVGARLRYEFTRRFAPYIGIETERAYGGTARFRRAEGDSSTDTRVVAGLRLWF